jgi:hypothetical protein
MKQNLKIGNGGVVTITDKHYKAAGGEAAIYVNNGMAYKLYHDPIHKIFPEQKMTELGAITNPQVIIPQQLVFDPTDGKPLGYTTKFVDNADPLVKLFTRTFKNDKNVSFQMINELVKQMQMVVADVHSAQCLVVDLNELNVLAGITSNSITPWFIDVDSYSTPSFKATAIMDSVRDRRVSKIDSKGVLHYHPDQMSDWFSFAVLAFSLYTNIHPYRGSHKDYKPNEKKQQMDDGISIFHPGVRTPPCVNDFKVIPSRHLGWFKDVFLNNSRSIPPLPDSSVPLMVPTQIITIQGTDKLGVEEINAYADDILAVFPIMGIYYVATKKHIYANKKEIGTHTAKKLLLCAASDGTILTAQQDLSDKIVFKNLTQTEPIGTAQSKDMFARNNAIYTISKGGKLIENSFTTFGNKVIHRINEIENVSVNSTQIFNGCLVQNLLGKYFLTLPYKLGSCFSKHISQLDGYRVISAKNDKNITIILAEKNGKYDKFIIVFKRDYSEYSIRIVSDVVFNEINFTVLDNGLCILLIDAGEVEIFVDNRSVEIIQNAPFDNNMPLFSTPDGAFFILNNSFYQIKKK